MAKKRPTKKPRVTEKQREAASSVVLMAETAARIKAEDCAAYAVMAFSDGNPADDEWRAPGLEAMKKFMLFGWTMFHAIGGLSVDWEKCSENAIKKLRQLPRKAK